jgi:hypothetical protein
MNDKSELEPTGQASVDLGGTPVQTSIQVREDLQIRLNPIDVLEMSSTADFTPAYDRAVDELEAQLWDETFESFKTFDLDAVLARLSNAKSMRVRYLEFLEQCTTDPSHPLSEEFDDLREFAVTMLRMAEAFEDVVHAVVTFRKGNGSEALRILDKRSTAFLDPTTAAANPFITYQVTFATQELTAAIRRSTLDHAGARAAYDRASMAAQAQLELISTLDPDQEGYGQLLAGAQFQLASSEALSCQMHHEQLMASGDLREAGDAAREAADAFRRAADHVEPYLPVLVGFLRASAHEACAQGSAADARLLLERGEWEAATDMARTVREHYQNASRACLLSALPTAPLMQERFLNTGFGWSVMFRRQLERERSYVSRMEELQLELRELYAGLRGALGPAGVVVNNATEMVTSVHQQVELTNRIELNVRSVLRDVPAALEGIDLPEAQKDALSAEALRLAEDEGDAATFFARVRRFAAGLATAVKTGAEAAGPVVQLLKALSVIQ